MPKKFHPFCTFTKTKFSFWTFFNQFLAFFNHLPLIFIFQLHRRSISDAFTISTLILIIIKFLAIIFIGSYPVFSINLSLFIYYVFNFILL